MENEENLFLCQSRSNFEINANLNCCQCSVSCNGENEGFTQIVDKNFTELCEHFRDSPNLLEKLSSLNIGGIYASF